ncbi:MAG: FAD-dependent monooxygenase [Chloroflexi bacterium]|nr:FAD-dependent monooxygenase [Chloroflexota bacterium]
MSERRIDDYDIVIVGAGPAGSAAAIHIGNLSPETARRTLVLEKAVFPRPKLCGGGITPHADALLHALKVHPDVPSVPIHAARFVYRDVGFCLRWKNLFRVVRREEFDAALASFVMQRGAALHQNEALVDYRQEADGLDVITDQASYRTKILVGADGANSLVRKKLGLVRSDRISRLLEILTPVDADRTPEFTEHTAVFDFSPMADGVQGYYWDFPSLKQGAAVMNRGLFDSRVHPERPRADLKRVFEAALERRSVELDHLQGHPERWYDARMRNSAPHIVLAGDAAGTEPLLGEGISHALNFGMVAAESALRALRLGDYSFRDYDRRVRWSALGSRLRFKRRIAQVLYWGKGAWFYRLGFGLIGLVLGE